MHRTSSTILAAALAWGAALALLPLSAHAVYKCVDNGKVTYQEIPCPTGIGSVKDDVAKKERYESYYQRLDSMAAAGAGAVQHDPLQELRMHQQELMARRVAQAERANAEQTGQSMPADSDPAVKACGGKMLEYPSIGMSDKNFRMCTLHAKYGAATQIVETEQDHVPLRLYIFPSAVARRVYLIDGVVTQIKP